MSTLAFYTTVQLLYHGSVHIHRGIVSWNGVGTGRAAEIMIRFVSPVPAACHRGIVAIPEEEHVHAYVQVLPDEDRPCIGRWGILSPRLFPYPSIEEKWGWPGFLRLVNFLGAQASMPPPPPMPVGLDPDEAAQRILATLRGE